MQESSPLAATDKHIKEVKNVEIKQNEACDTGCVCETILRGVLRVCAYKIPSGVYPYLTMAQLSHDQFSRSTYLKMEI